MSLDLRLLNLLVCPLCKGPLELLRDGEDRPQELACAADRLAFPIRDGLPVMLEHEARALGPRNADPLAPAASPAPAPAPAPTSTPAP